MRTRPLAIGFLALIGLLSTACTSAVHGGVIVADRLTNSVFRYSDTGVYQGLVVQDATNLNQPSGIALSPDQSKLFVASSQNSQVVRYDFNAVSGTASNPTVFAQAANGLSFPSSILFSQDGNRIFVSNLGGTGVAQFNLDGSSAGAPINGLIGGGAIFQYSGLEFAPNGDLLVGGFQDFPAGTSGSVARSNTAITSISDFIAPSTSLNGASGLLVNGNDLYVSGLFAGNIQRFNATTGALDPSFSLSGLAFPQDLMLAPDGNGFLAGVLGIANGSGNISRYDFQGNLLGVFASAGAGGFTEPTSMAYFTAVPEPSSLLLVGLATFAAGVSVRRRRG